jgi:hypothetical protein
VKEIFLLFAGYFLGMMDWTIGAAEIGFRSLSIPLIGFSAPTHWWWDFLMLGTFLSVAGYVFCNTKQKNTPP